MVEWLCALLACAFAATATFGIFELQRHCHEVSCAHSRTSTDEDGAASQLGWKRGFVLVIHSCVKFRQTSHRRGADEIPLLPFRCICTRLRAAPGSNSTCHIVRAGAIHHRSAGCDDTQLWFLRVGLLVGCAAYTPPRVAALRVCGLICVGKACARNLIITTGQCCHAYVTHRHLTILRASCIKRIAVSHHLLANQTRNISNHTFGWLHRAQPH